MLRAASAGVGKLLSNGFGKLTQEGRSRRMECFVEPSHWKKKMYQFNSIAWVLSAFSGFFPQS